VPTDRIGALEALLGQTEAAHGVYETTELNGVYDKQWPTWYAAYALDHGLGELLGRPVTVAEVEQLLASSWAEIRAPDSNPSEPWAAYTARRLAEHDDA
jgi:hypothetical protein